MHDHPPPDTPTAWCVYVHPLTSRELLLGTDGGALYSSLQQLHAKREGATSLLLDFRDARRCITDAAQEMLPGGRRAVFVATPGSLYVAVGGPGLVGALGRCVVQRGAECMCVLR